jgi:CheY-like chemotaxis protein
VNLEFDIGDAVGSVYADRRDVEQVLLSLALDARDAAPNAGRIVLSAAGVEIERPSAEHPGVPPGNYVCVTVAANGAEDRRAAHRAYRRYAKGGLGMAALFGLVSRNGGLLVAASELGRGPTFRVYVPRWKEGNKQPVPAPAGGSETVLVLQDDESVRSLQCQVLSRYGYTAIDASSPEEAVRHARDYQGRIDLLITDMLLPHRSGREVASQVRERHPEIKVLFVSGQEDVESDSEPQGDSEAWLPKPFTLEALAIKVREVLDSRPADSRVE